MRGILSTIVATQLMYRSEEREPAYGTSSWTDTASKGVWVSKEKALLPLFSEVVAGASGS